MEGVLKQDRHRHPPQYLIQRHRHHQQAAPQLVSPHLVVPAHSYISKEAPVSTTVEEMLQYKVIWHRAACKKQRQKIIQRRALAAQQHKQFVKQTQKQDVILIQGLI